MARQVFKEKQLMSVQRVFIVRHGETDYNVEHRWQGHLDVPLNENGHYQAQSLAKYLKNETIDAIFASDLKRAYDTAQAIADIKQMTVNADARLREINLGVFQGLTNTQIHEAYPYEKMQWDTNNNFSPLDGESRNQVQERVYQAWQEITNHPKMKTVVLLSHGGTIRMLLERVFPDRKDYIKLKNTSISIIERNSDEAWYPSALNITPHIL